MRNSAIKFKNWQMKNGFSSFNFPIKIGNWKLKNFYHFSIFNFESKLKYLKMSFSIPILKWKLNDTFGARITFLISIFQFQQKMKIGIWEITFHFTVLQQTKYEFEMLLFFTFYFHYYKKSKNIHIFPRFCFQFRQKMDGCLGTRIVIHIRELFSNAKNVLKSHDIICS